MSRITGTANIPYPSFEECWIFIINISFSWTTTFDGLSYSIPDTRKSKSVNSVSFVGLQKRGSQDANRKGRGKRAFLPKVNQSVIWVTKVSKTSKVILRQSWKITLLQNIGHLIPVGGAATFTYLNTARIFLGSIFSDVAALHFTAKMHEIFMVALSS